MKVVAIVGSPRKKGNTDILVDTFLEGATQGGAAVEKHFLAALEINPCQGCFRNCMVKPITICPRFDDDMTPVMEAMSHADLLVFASPLYCGTYSSYMARFFERMIPFLEVQVVGREGTVDGYRLVNNPLQGKKAVIALVQDLIYPEVGALALDVFEKNVVTTFRMEIVEKIQVVDVRDKGDIRNRRDQLKEIFETAESLTRQ